jgi:Purple acid Phosphatase, N-terminal domain
VDDVFLFLHGLDVVKWQPSLGVSHCRMLRGHAFWIFGLGSKGMHVTQVYWGKVKGDWDGSVTATSSTVISGGDCSLLGSQTLNQAVLTGLQPSTLYYYKFGDVSFSLLPSKSVLSAPVHWAL